MVDISLKIKPTSVNKAWRSRRFKSDEYKAFEEELLPNVPLIDNLGLIFQQGNFIVSFFRNQLRNLWKYLLSYANIVTVILLSPPPIKLLKKALSLILKALIKKSLPPLQQPYFTPLHFKSFIKWRLWV